MIGLGVISRFYGAALTGESMPGARLTAVCDLDPARLAPYRGRAACLDSAPALLARDDVDAVVVALPNDLHLPVCHQALLAGKAVCVEKPLATRLADGEALVALSERLSVPLFTAFHRRYNDNLVELARRLAGGAGPARRATIRYLERIEEHAGHDRWYLEPSRCGGGCVADNGPNAFDLAAMLLGDGLELTAAEVVRDRRGVDVRAGIELRARTGARARVELDWAYPGERKDVAVRTAGGRTLRADMLAGFAGFKRSLWHEYRAVLRDFLAACRGHRRGPDGGLAALRLVDAVYRSESQEGPRAATTR
jgi:predicted dehydrogenase